MFALLVHNPRDATLIGVAAGREFRLATLGHPSGERIYDWVKTQELRTGAAAERRIHGWDHVYELRSGKSAAAARSLTIAQGSPAEVYDWPGEYAQRFDGARSVGKARPPPGHPARGAIVCVCVGARGQTLCLHGPPHCGDPRCIVVGQRDWPALHAAMRQTRQTTIVVEV